MPNIEKYIPKEVTQQSEFLKQYPEYDGRGIKIAIIDTDIIDKNLPGMQKTSTGLPKVLNCIGCKSGITVNTSTIVKSNGKNVIIVSSGREIIIPPEFKNPSDKWYTGCTTFEQLYEDDEDDEKCEGKENLKEINAPNMDKKILPPLNDEIVDCVVWFDGEKWQACINTSFSTNLIHMKILTNFDGEHEIAFLPNNCPYCIYVHDEGNSLQILSPPDDHGILVAQVAAAYFPDNPKSNGLAPGAQIISIDYSGDIEKDCIELEVDILNLSIGFKITKSTVKIFKKMVNELGIIITYAAGNDGPFYSSIPKNTFEISDYCFLIGAIFPEEMRKAFHYKQSRNSVLSFSSKGPLLSSGALGIDFVAPGDAIIDLPKWNPNKNEYCHGTSFAAPNVGGSIACLLTALKENSIQYSPTQIKMALAKTAYLPRRANKLAFGNGIIQIKNAFEFIKKSIRKNNFPYKSLVPFSIDLLNQKGILCYQNKYKLPQEYRYYVNFDPTFNTKWALELTSKAKKFITHSKIDNFFIVKIHTSLLEEGSINYAEIRGIVSSNSLIPPLFNLPITVICPAECFNEKEIILNPGPPIHFFFNIPFQSQKCCIKITPLKIKKDINIVLEHSQKKKDSLGWCGEHDNVKGYHDLKITTNETIKTILIDIEKNVEKFFEICIYQSERNELKFKLNIDFLKTDL